MAGDRDAALRVVAAHINHGLRPGAEHDEAHVGRIAARLNIPFTCARITLEQPARGNLYAAARAGRYEALSDIARRENARTVAVAHHADDQFETILMNLCRGCAIDAVSGMRWVRTLPRDHTAPDVDECRLIRPLLDLRATDCRELCAAAGVTWIDDPANRNRDRVRARLRQDVTPVLESLWPGAAVRAAATAAECAELATLPPEGREQFLTLVERRVAHMEAAGLLPAGWFARIRSLD